MDYSMSIIRVKKEPGDYYLAHKTPVQDANLSYKARGVHSYLMSKPDDWQLQIRDLINQSPDGEYSVRAAVKELEDARYITKKRKFSDGSRFAGYEYTIYEVPYRGKPHMEEPNTDNLEHTNNDYTNNETTNIYYDKFYKDMSEFAPIGEFLLLWEEYLPDKVQSRAQTVAKKFRARWKSEHFRQHYKSSILKAAGSSHLRGSGWFQMEYFLRNEDNYKKILGGVFDSFDTPQKKHEQYVSSGLTTEQVLQASIVEVE